MIRLLVALCCLVSLMISGCGTVPVDRPCGVIIDSLKTVNGRTAEDQKHIDAHYERGYRAGCWE